ncbi:unnamed protein product [Ilex paraguariensis]|uniref:adenylate kinase n=1 Tax=Ilex paraguariensis TaxID=185542 RepID=A0ABC8TW84_9AQUA
MDKFLFVIQLFIYGEFSEQVVQAVGKTLCVQKLLNTLGTLILMLFMIENMIKKGKLVPSEVTIKLLQRTMKESGNEKFLIDGFPRNEENHVAFEKIEREDDNIETIRKWFKVFAESTLPVVEYYASKGKVWKIDAGRPLEEVFESVKPIFSPAKEKVGSHLVGSFTVKIWNLKRLNGKTLHVLAV